jgi:IclR family acetate operon transcriptional repressor
MKARNRQTVNKSRNSHPTSIQSLFRALDLLELLAAESNGLRLIDVAWLAKLPVSSAHRFLTTLETRRYVFQDKTTKCWHVGSQSLAIGASFGRRRNLGALALPVMRRLCERSSHTINLAMLDYDSVVLLCQAQGREPPDGIARAGARWSLMSTALGQSAVAAMPENEITAILSLSSNALETRALGKICTAPSLHETRVRRFAIDDEINVAGVRCIAAPIFDEFSTPIAAISMAGDSRRMRKTQPAEAGSHVLQAANEITLAIGGRTPAGYR